MDTDKIIDLIKQENEQTRRHFDEKAAEMGRHFDEKAAESQRHFDAVAESLKSEIRVIAEGHGVLVEKIDGLGTRMDRLETQVENFAIETRTNFEEVRAAVKFSYAELDRRVSHLESTIASIDARVSRLESRP